MVIDSLSKFGWVEKLKNKKPQSIINGLKNIFKSGRMPKVLITDSGTEFNNQFMKRFLKERNIIHNITRNTEVKAAIVERWNRTMKERITKYMTAFKTKRFIDVIDDLVTGYNNTKHSRTKFIPVSVNKANEKEVFLNLYRDRIINKISKFNKGDKVRIKKIKQTFEKGYTPNFTGEVFIIDKVLNTIPIRRYVLKDEKGEKLLGSFYPEEILKI
jgi:hypothetical protein